LPFLLSSPKGICFLQTTGCPTLDATSSRQGGGIARGSARGSCFCRCLCHPRRRSASYVPGYLQTSTAATSTTPYPPAYASPPTHPLVSPHATPFRKTHPQSQRSEE